MLKNFLGVEMNHSLSLSKALTQKSKRSKHKKKSLRLSLLVGLLKLGAGSVSTALAGS